MKSPFLVLALLTGAATDVAADKLMEDCERGSRSRGMQCISRNGVCLEVVVDGQKTRPIARADRQRIVKLPDMDDVCHQLPVPVSANFRVQARGGGLEPDFVGTVESLGALLLPLDDFDPEFDRRIEPLNSFNLEADGYRDGTWQLKPETRFAMPGAGAAALAPGECVLVLRVHGTDNWDKQEILLRIDPARAPGPEDPGTRPGVERADRR
jgi:hypothetical protein